MALIELWKVFVSLALMALGWFGRQLYQDTRDLSREINEVKLNYVPRAEQEKFRQEMRENFNEIKELIKEIRK